MAVEPCPTHALEREHPDQTAAAAYVEAHRGHFTHPLVNPPPHRCRGCGRWWTARVKRDHCGERRYPTQEAAEEGLRERAAFIPRLADVRPYHCEPCDAWFTPGDIPVSCDEHSPGRLFATCEDAMRYLAGRFGGQLELYGRVPHRCRQCGSWYLPPRVCLRSTHKMWFPTWQQAREAAGRATRNFPDKPSWAYPCEACGQFHLTTKEPAPVTQM